MTNTNKPVYAEINKPRNARLKRLFDISNLRTIAQELSSSQEKGDVRSKEEISKYLLGTKQISDGSTVNLTGNHKIEVLSKSRVLVSLEVETLPKKKIEWHDFIFSRFYDSHK